MHRSVGATVVEMFTGKEPYTNEKFENSMAIIYQVGSNQLNPLTSMRRPRKIADSVFVLSQHHFLQSILKKCFQRYNNNIIIIIIHVLQSMIHCMQVESGYVDKICNQYFLLLFFYYYSETGNRPSATALLKAIHDHTEETGI